MAAQSSGNWLRSVKRKHKQLEQGNQFSVPGPDCDPVARVEIGNESPTVKGSEEYGILYLAEPLDACTKLTSKASGKLCWKLCDNFIFWKCLINNSF
ncbi:hypothetical protein JHK86_016385 [Glycine max]|nr:hypothetical protein JHK86_016385 [Glycine max]